MDHNPVNHPARPVYRALAALTGLYLVIFGGLALINGGEFFGQDPGVKVLGQGINPGGGLVLAVLGLIALAAAVIGRNVDTRVNRALAYLLAAIALASLAVSHTGANILNVSVVTCIVLMTLSMVLLMAAMYGRVGSDKDVHAWEQSRLFG
ncbi:DUF4383 domain-containing protein [Micromonospora zhanjiangensis]|uniref:DUF4383 domain-containing protein n=1 Tax=Micromonospora zhanjiangensis TaxID=1522057 RepID=A0ABV8KFD5_9ACTN